MKIRRFFLSALGLTAFTFSAGAEVLTGIGSPDDIFFGCDSSLKSASATFCQLSFNETGNISGNISTFISPGANRLLIGTGPNASNPAWTDSLGNALEVKSYYVSSTNSDFNGLPLSLDEGTIGICESGRTLGGACDAGGLSDVLIFTNAAHNTLGPAGYNRIDVLSGDASFTFTTDVNTPEVADTAAFTVLNPEGGGGEDIFYTFDSNSASTPEPSSLMLMGTGVLLLGNRLRRRRSASANR